MPREKAAYRDTLERIVAAFPNRELIKGVELAEFLGITPKTARSWFREEKRAGGYPVALVARKLS